jgi:GNAT superfamily N-acetyltransferase
MEYRLRAAEPSDAAVCMRHRIRMMEDMGMSDNAGRASIRDASVKYFARAIADGTFLGVFAVDEAGRIAAGGGLLLVPWPPSPFDGSCDRAIIVNMYTEPEHRRRGLARRIVDRLVDLCRGRGLAVVRLNASDMGRPVYAGAGFVESNEMVLRLRTQP